MDVFQGPNSQEFWVHLIIIQLNNFENSQGRIKVIGDFWSIINNKKMITDDYYSFY